MLTFNCSFCFDPLTLCCIDIMIIIAILQQIHLNQLLFLMYGIRALLLFLKMVCFIIARLIICKYTVLIANYYPKQILFYIINAFNENLEFLGRVVFPLNNLQNKQKIEVWQKLQKRSRKSRVAGQLHIIVQIVDVCF